MSIPFPYELRNLHYTDEVKDGLVQEVDAVSDITFDNGLSFIDAGKNSLLLGRSEKNAAYVKVCINIGISNKAHLDQALHTVEHLNSLSFKPNILFDHTRGGLTKKPLWKYMIENFDGVIAIAPVVFCFDKEKGLDRTKFLENIEEMAEAGIRLMLFHPTAKHELWEMAEKRMWPTTSWNGSLLFRDMKLNNRNDSLVALLFEDILAILKKYNVTCDIGSVFRPARISEALDSVHLKELSLQEDYLLMAKRTGVLTIREAVGHISLDKIEDFANKVSPNTPIMPLPVSTDAAVGFDHVACAVATTMLGYFTNLGIINPVTRVEHTGDIPTLENTVEALMTAKTVAHSLDLRNIPQASRIDNLLSDLRQRGKVCHITGGLFDCEDIPRDHRCDRCDIHCPFLMKKER